jgi:hypothetical protein
MNRYVYAKRYPGWVKWIYSVFGKDLVDEKPVLQPRKHAIPANQIEPLPYKAQSDWYASTICSTAAYCSVY